MNNRIAVCVSLVFVHGLAGCAVDPGPQGADGAPGRDGAQSLIAIDLELPGANCPKGGQALKSGLDENRNGVLDPSEVTRTAYVCNGADGEKGADGSGGGIWRTRAGVELAGERCAFGGMKLEAGPDENHNGVLDEDEVDPNVTQAICHDAPAWRELPSLPQVKTVFGFALGANDDDRSAHLGFMFNDPGYQAELLASGVLGSGYSGGNTYVTYRYDAAFGEWVAYEGRKTGQTYSYSELVLANGESFYTTSYPAAGGLLSVIRNGGGGAFALTAAFNTRKAHSIAVFPGSTYVYALVAQKFSGLTLSRIEAPPQGGFSSMWDHLFTVAPVATDVRTPQLVAAGTQLAASYVLGDRASIRLAPAPDNVTIDDDFPEVGDCQDAVLADLAWDGRHLYVACVDHMKSLTVKRALLDPETPVTWEIVQTGVTGEVDDLDLEASPGVVSLAVRQGPAVRVYQPLENAAPSFDAVLSGTFDLVRTTAGAVLVVAEGTNDVALRTFMH